MEQLIVDELLRMDDETEIRAYLRNRPGSATLALIDEMRKQVDQLVGANVAEAVRIANLTWSIVDQVDDPLAPALGMRARAKAYWAQGSYEQALDWFDRAEKEYRILCKDLEAARVARSKVAVLMYLGRYDEALAHAERARAVFERQGESRLLAELDTNVGNIYHRQDEYQKALECYERARQVLVAVGDNAALGFIEVNCANALSMLNRLSESAVLYETARKRLSEAGMPVAAAQAEYNLAYLLYIQRHFDESILLFQKVKEFHKQGGSPVTVALCDLDLLEIYLELNLFDDVLASCGAVETTFTQFGMKYEAAKVMMYKALAHLHRKELSPSREYMLKARRIFSDESNAVYCALLDVHLSVVELCQGQTDEAQRLCQSAQEAFDAAGLPFRAAYARLLIAQAAYRRSDFDAARAQCNEILKRLQENPAPWLAFQCHHLLGNLLAAEDRGAAASHYQTSIECIEDMCLHIRPDEFKSAFLRDKLKVYEDLISLCLNRQTAKGRSEAFTWVERAKSRSLVDLLSRSTVDPSEASPLEGPLLDRWRSLRQELNWLYDRVNHQAPQTDQRGAARSAYLQDEIRVRERAMAELLRQFQLASSKTGPQPQRATLGIEGIQDCLEDDEALLEFYFTNQDLKTFVVTKQGLDVVNHGATRGRVSQAISDLQFQLEKFLFGPSYTMRHLPRLRQSANHQLLQLYRLLFEPLMPKLEGKRLVIVPHDLLHYVPFHALWNGQDYVIDHHEISYAPSASVFRLCQQKPAPTSDKVLVLGLPSRNMPYLETEARMIKELYPQCSLLLHEAATREQFYRMVNDQRIIHIASHGLFRYDNPLFSALRLADSWLSFYDVFGLHLNADMVILSACYSGLSQVGQGDELLGLLRGFLYAGASSLVASLWSAHDHSTSQFMQTFYQALKAGVPKRAALRKAALATKEQFDHPYHWAPFILVGKR